MSEEVKAIKRILLNLLFVIVSLLLCGCCGKTPKEMAYIPVSCQPALAVSQKAPPAPIFDNYERRYVYEYELTPAQESDDFDTRIAKIPPRWQGLTLLMAHE